MSPRTFRSFAFTIRPSLGVKIALEEGVIRWLSRYSGFLCAEMDGEARHLHGVIYLETSKTKGDINKSLESVCSRKVDDWNSSQNIVLRRGTKICYNDDFITEYLAKEDNILYSNIPENTSDYYPTLEEQKAIMAKSNAVDQRFHQWEIDFNKSKYRKKAKKLPQCAILFVAQFLEDMMFCCRKYPVVTDPKKRKEYARALLMYVSKDCSGLNSIYKEEQDIIDFNQEKLDEVNSYNYTDSEDEDESDEESESDTDDIIQ